MRYPAIAFLGSAATRRYPLLTTMTYSQAYPPKGVFGSLGREERPLKKIRKDEVERIQGF